jgi:hypothetical protein
MGKNGTSSADVAEISILRRVNNFFVHSVVFDKFCEV